MKPSILLRIVNYFSFWKYRWCLFVHHDGSNTILAMNFGYIYTSVYKQVIFDSQPSSTKYLGGSSHSSGNTNNYNANHARRKMFYHSIWYRFKWSDWNWLGLILLMRMIYLRIWLYGKEEAKMEGEFQGPPTKLLCMPNIHSFIIIIIIEKYLKRDVQSQNAKNYECFCIGNWAIQRFTNWE